MKFQNEPSKHSTDRARLECHITNRTKTSLIWSNSILGIEPPLNSQLKTTTKISSPKITRKSYVHLLPQSFKILRQSFLYFVFLLFITQFYGIFAIMSSILQNKVTRVLWILHPHGIKVSSYQIATEIFSLKCL